MGSDLEDNGVIKYTYRIRSLNVLDESFVFRTRIVLKKENSEKKFRKEIQFMYYERIKKVNFRYCFLTLVMAVLLCAACGDEKAASMSLIRTEGKVGVQNGAGMILETAEDMKLHDGYQLDTERASYAWLELDRTKLAKMDEVSTIEIQKIGSDLTIQLQEGSIFFQVTQPLGEEETMRIRTSTMAVGIRGTCGWVDVDGGTVTVGLLEGKVECTSADGEGKAVTVEAGWKAVLRADGQITVTPLEEKDVPAFVRSEAAPLLEEVLGIAQAAPDNGDNGDSSDGIGNDNGESGEMDTGSGTGGEEDADPYQLPSELEDGIERTVITVSDSAEIRALRNTDLSNTEIRLAGEAFDLGDGVFMVQNAVNLRIVGMSSTQISGGRNGGESIFFAKGCENLQLYQITFGNSTDGEINECVSLYQCSGVQIENCVFYSGMYGLNGSDCDAMVNDCEIRDCPEGGLYWRGGSLTLTDCTLHDNGASSAVYDNSPMFQISDTTLRLVRCSMYDNTCTTYYGASLIDDGHGGRMWVSDGSNFTEVGTSSEGNLWDADSP